MAIARCLSAKEAGFWENTPPAIFIIEYKGKIDPKTLENSFLSLAQKYPALRATIREASECSYRYVFNIEDMFDSKLVVLDGDRDTVIAYRRQVLREHASGNQSANLSGLVLVRHQTGGYVLFIVHHALFMFAQIHAYTSELFQLYTQLVTVGKVGNIEPQSFPISNEELLDKHLISAVRSSKNRKKLTGVSVDGGTYFTPTPQTLGYKSIVRFNIEETASIVATARNNHIKVHHVVASAMALAMRKRRNYKENAPLHASVAVDWTKHTKMPPTAATGAVTHHQLTLNLPINITTITVAKDLQAMIDQLEPHESNSPEVDIDITVNNRGKFPDLPHPEGLEFTDFILFDETLLDEWESFNLRPQYWAKCTVIPMTFNGRLSIPVLLRDDVECSVIEDFIREMSSFANNKSIVSGNRN